MPCFDLLPDEVVYNILLNVHSINDMCMLMLTCARFNTLANEDQFWRDYYCSKRFPKVADYILEFAFRHGKSWKWMVGIHKNISDDRHVIADRETTGTKELHYITPDCIRHFEVTRGSFVNGKAHGFCFVDYSENGKHTGSFAGFYSDGQKNGLGRYLDTINRVKCENSYVSGCMTGRGQWLFDNGDSYLGDFVNGKFDGNGMFIKSNGQVIHKGQYRHGKMNGHAYMHYERGSIYQGLTRHGQKHGQGVYIFNSGVKLVGNWNEGMMEGLFSLHYETGAHCLMMTRNDKAIHIISFYGPRNCQDQRFSGGPLFDELEWTFMYDVTYQTDDGLQHMCTIFFPSQKFIEQRKLFVEYITSPHCGFETDIVKLTLQHMSHETTHH